MSRPLGTALYASRLNHVLEWGQAHTERSSPELLPRVGPSVQEVLVILVGKVRQVVAPQVRPQSLRRFSSGLYGGTYRIVTFASFFALYHPAPSMMSTAWSAGPSSLDSIRRNTFIVSVFADRAAELHPPSTLVAGSSDANR
jgi:hypothetical protein